MTDTDANATPRTACSARVTRFSQRTQDMPPTASVAVRRAAAASSGPERSRVQGSPAALTATATPAGASTTA